MKIFSRKKIKGLALSSGGAKGLAHIGVLKAIIEKGMAIDMIAGSSIGALVAACYVVKNDIIEIENLVLGMDWRSVVKLADPNPAMFFRGFINGERIKDLLKPIIGDIEFKDLRIPLAVIATDAETGEEVIITKGPVMEAVMASISIPAVFIPAKHDGRFLMDGGTVDPMPVGVVKGMGADYIIACNVVQIPKRKQDNNLGSIQDLEEKWQTAPNVLDVLNRARYIMEYEITKFKIKDADLIISPNVIDIGVVEFYRGKEAIEAGYKAAMDVLK